MAARAGRLRAILPISHPWQAPIDLWSLAHLASGVALGLLTHRWWVALGLLVAYEVFEAGLRRVQRHGQGLFEFESWRNIAGDLVVGMGGWAVAAVPLAWAFPSLPFG